MCRSTRALGQWDVDPDVGELQGRPPAEQRRSWNADEIALNHGLTHFQGAEPASWRPSVLTLYRRFGQGKKGGFLRLFFSRCGEGCTAGGGAVRSEHGSILCDAGSRLRLKCGCGLSGEGTSYLSIDSSRSSDGLKGLSRSETQCGVRGTERAVICVATFERWLGAIHSRLQDARGHRFQMGCSQHRASGASRGFAAYTGRALDVFARVARLGVLSRRLIFLATRFIASARSAWLWALARSPRVLSWAWEPGS